MSQALGRIRQAAKQRKKEKFTTLFHHISVERLRLSYFAIKKDAVPGANGLTWQDYGADLDRNIGDLHDRVLRGAYRALPGCDLGKHPRPTHRIEVGKLCQKMVSCLDFRRTQTCPHEISA